MKNVVLYEIYMRKIEGDEMTIDCTSGNYRDKTSHNKQIYTLKKNLLKFENEFIDIENHEFDGKKWEERGMRN
jgi:hypothetical protein